VIVRVHVQGQQLQMTLTLICGSALLPADADLNSPQQSQRTKNSTATRNVNEAEEGQLIIDLLHVVPQEVFMPIRNGDWVIGELSRRIEPRNAFLDRFRASAIRGENSHDR
jgi:hypothetical protein